MQFDLSRAFPYPVLRPGVDDYLDSDIQAAISIAPAKDNQAISASVEIAMSVSEIKDLIASDQASYVVVFACRDTYFRHSFTSTSNVVKVEFDAGALRGDVVIYTYVIAKKKIQGFSCSWINPEFGDGPFSFDVGSVLAVDRPQSVYVDRDTFRPISSCFDLVKSEDVSGGEYKILPSGDKIQIAVNAALKGRITEARNSKENRAILLNSMYFSAVVQCLALLKKNDEFDEFRWAKIFRQRILDQGINLENEFEVWVAQ